MANYDEISEYILDNNDCLGNVEIESALGEIQERNEKIKGSCKI